VHAQRLRKKRRNLLLWESEVFWRLHKLTAI